MQIISIIEKAVSHHREHGQFVVLYQGNIKKFHTLVSAFIFYYYLSMEASLWDVAGDEQLLEKKIAIKLVADLIAK